MAESLKVASVGLGRWGKELARGARAAGIDVVSCYARTEVAVLEAAKRSVATGSIERVDTRTPGAP